MGKSNTTQKNTLVNKRRLSSIKKIYGEDYLKNKKILDVGGGVNPIIKGKNVFIADIKIQKMNKDFYKNRYYKIDIEKKKLIKNLI